MVPNGIAGEVVSIESGEFTVEQTVAVVKDAKGAAHKLNMIQRWPVRIARPYEKKYVPSRPMNSGQRIIDKLFPIAKGRPRPLRFRQDRRAAPAREVV